MNKEDLNYLVWRCRFNWPGKYTKTDEYIKFWISNITKEQLDYFRKERENLISKNIYKEY